MPIVKAHTFESFRIIRLLIIKKLISKINLLIFIDGKQRRFIFLETHTIQVHIHGIGSVYDVISMILHFLGHV